MKSFRIFISEKNANLQDQAIVCPNCKFKFKYKLSQMKSNYKPVCPNCEFELLNGDDNGKFGTMKPEVLQNKSL